MCLLPVILGIIIAIVTLIIGAAGGIFAGIKYRKKIAEAEIGSAEVEAKRIVDEAVKNAETKKKEALIEAKEDIIKIKNEAERELKERRNEVSRLERRIAQKEETLDKKTEAIDKKDEAMNKKISELSERESEVVKKIERQDVVLQEISGYTKDQAKEMIIEKLQDEMKHETARKIVEFEQHFKDEADKRAKNILALAIQRFASDYVSEVTVSAVPLPNDEMKGRIIGREGRNIRTIETLTGVDLIIDDTPEAITLSSHDPVRREVARLTLEKLIVDGRIHPARIEETVAKSRREVENIIKQEGERATFETGLHGINPELVKLLGRLKYRTSYGQNVLAHSIEVAHLSGIMAAELGADVNMAKRAGLLHDIGKALTHEMEGSHIQLGIDIAKKYKENKDIIHAIEAHHGDIEPQTVIAIIVQAADAISGARPGARRENLENYIKRLEKLEEIANSFQGIEKSYAIQAGREIRIIVNPEAINDDNMVFLARDIVKKIESELEYPGQIKIHLVRESRIIDYAK
ncbi:MAG: ribonuclease Y [Oscillospiraceae bacterium]|nr:ribonuclease Y [Oscillospiraceae bacterium]